MDGIASLIDRKYLISSLSHLGTHTTAVCLLIELYSRWSSYTRVLTMRDDRLPRLGRRLWFPLLTGSSSAAVIVTGWQPYSIVWTKRTLLQWKPVRFPTDIVGMQSESNWADWGVVPLSSTYGACLRIGPAESRPAAKVILLYTWSGKVRHSSSPPPTDHGRGRTN